MKKLTGLIFGAATLATIAVVSAPMAAAPDGAGVRSGPFAHRAQMGGGFGAGAPLITIALKHKTELNLAADQVANLEKIKSHYQSQVAPLQQQLQAAEKEIADLSQQSPVNLIQVKAKIQETEKFRSEMRYLRLEALENGRSVLNAQQREQLKSIVGTRMHRFNHSLKQPS
jgi:Spy/CpxP family protein refolding chaperone